MAKKYDVVVIGAGNGGLVAAAKLAKEGKRVLLVEKHNLPGGSATSFVRGRFEFEASLHELCNMAPYNPPRADLKRKFDDIGVGDKIDWIALTDCFRMISLDKSEDIDFRMPVGREEILDACEKYCPGSRDKVDALFTTMHNMNLGIDYLGEITDFKPQIITDILFKYHEFIDGASYKVNEMFDKFEIPQRARDFLGGYWLYLGTSFDEMSFLHYFTMFEAYAIDGPVIPKSRSHEISSALAEAFEEHGGDLWYNCEVKKIITSGGKVFGVELKDGEIINCDYIVCNASPYTLYTKLLPKEDVPEFQTKKLNSLKLGPKGFSFFLGLDASPEELGLDDHTYFIFDTMDQNKQVKLCEKRATNNMQATVCLNKSNPGCSPEGTSVMYFTSIFMGDHAWDDVTDETYVKLKREFADKMITNFETATGIKLRDHIEEIEIAGPITYARYLGSPNGAIYGFENTGSFDLVSRIVTDFIGPNVKGLYYAGGYGTKSLGFNPSYSSGYDAANAILVKMKGDAK